MLKNPQERQKNLKYFLEILMDGSRDGAYGIVDINDLKNQLTYFTRSYKFDDDQKLNTYSSPPAPCLPVGMDSRKTSFYL